jgi:hypothetical protein
MPLITDEQKIKRPSDFLKLEEENIVVLKSNVYTVLSHWLNNKKLSVGCDGKECKLCQNGNKVRNEYYYRAVVNDEEGFLRIPASAFYDMNRLETVIKKKDETKDKRHYQWLILKEGEGRDTRYTTSKDELIKINEKELEENNKKLEKVIMAYEKKLNEKYLEAVKEYKNNDEAIEEPKEIENEENVKPEDIPF